MVLPYFLHCFTALRGLIGSLQFLGIHRTDQSRCDPCVYHSCLVEFALAGNSNGAVNKPAGIARWRTGGADRSPLGTFKAWLMPTCVVKFLIGWRMNVSAPGIRERILLFAIKSSAPLKASAPEFELFTALPTG